MEKSNDAKVVASPMRMQLLKSIEDCNRIIELEKRLNPPKILVILKWQGIFIRGNSFTSYFFVYIIPQIHLKLLHHI